MDLFWNLTLHALLTLSLSAVSIGWYQGCASRSMKMLALTPILLLGSLYVLGVATETPGQYLFLVSSGGAGVFVIGTSLLWLWRERLFSWRVSAMLAASLFVVHVLSSQVLQLKLDSRLMRDQGDAAEIIHKRFPTRTLNEGNAAPIYSKLATQFASPEFEALSKRTPTDEALALLEAYAPLMEELQRAVQLPVCSFENSSGSTQVNNIGLLRLANGLNHGAHAARDSGNRVQAFRLIRAQLDLAEHICQAPFLAKLASAMRSNALDTIATLDPHPEEVLLLQDVWTKLTDQHLHMLRLKEAFMIHAMVHYRTYMDLTSDYLGLKSMARDARIIQEYSGYRSAMRELQKMASTARVHELESATQALFGNNNFLPKHSGIPAKLPQQLAACDQRLEPYQINAAAAPR